jgi:8-oxo-dGTP diphosphatase
LTEEEYLKSYDSSGFQKPSVAVDLVLFTVQQETLQVLLTERTQYPYIGRPALPGVFVRIDETLDEAAQRALYQKTGLHDIYFEQLYTWGGLGRDPRMRIISVSYYALVPASQIPETEQNKFFSVEEILQHEDIAFDHKEIIIYGRERIRNKVNYTDIAFSLVPEEFTLPQLQKIYEILLGQKLYKANFRKKIADKIQQTEKFTSGTKHRPSRIYRKKD